MYKKHKIFLVLVFFICSCQHISASEGKKSTPKTGTTDVQEKAPQRQVGSSTHNPSDLLLKLDFETEEVKPMKGKKADYDQLVLRTPQGKQSAVGIMYEGGTENDRRARIIADPTHKGNYVFSMWLKNARVPGQSKGAQKGRIQMNLSGFNRTAVFQRYRMYLPADMDYYRQFPQKNTWFTINDLWMGDRWKKHPYPYRLSLKIGKPEGVGKPLYFVLVASMADGGSSKDIKWQQTWAEVAPNYEIPVGEWIDIEIGYKAGDNRTGRFYMGVKRENEANYTTVFDLTNWTYNPNSPEPVPMTSWQPLKVYTSSAIIDFIRSKGGVAQVFYDDLEIYANW